MHVLSYSLNQRWKEGETSPFLPLSHQNQLTSSHKNTTVLLLFLRGAFLILGCEELWIFNSFSPVPGLVGSRYQSETWSLRVRKGLAARKPSCPNPEERSSTRRTSLRQHKINVTYLQVNCDQGETERLPIKTTEWFQRTKKSVDIVWLCIFCKKKKEAKEAKNRLDVVSQILSLAKAPAPGSYAALLMQPSLLLSSDLYLNLQKVFFSFKNTRISPPHLGAHLS